MKYQLLLTYPATNREEFPPERYDDEEEAQEAAMQLRYKYPSWDIDSPMIQVIKDYD